MVEKNCLSYWFPKIEDRVPVPETEWIKFSDGMDLMSVFGSSNSIFIIPLQNFVLEAADKLGYPAFLRTGRTSAKHNFENACFLEEDFDISGHIQELLEYSHMVSPAGIAHDVWAVREFLESEPVFHCQRYGNMPVVRERRYFVDGYNEQVLYSIPYWPKEALKAGEPTKENWEEDMEFLNSFPEEGAELAEEVSCCVDGQWSVDVFEANDGLYVTDMALAQASYGWDESRV
jgi:hypothetical protein